MQPLLWLLAATLLVALAGVAVLLRSQRRTRRQLEAIMNRIDELEHRAPSDEVEGSREPSAGQPDEVLSPDEVQAKRPSRDVLAGRTSFVRRAAEGELTQPASLGGQAVAVVHARIRDNLSAADLAAELSISLRTLERGLVADLGCSPRQLILAMKMREARRLLESGRYRVNEVASRLGFATPSHFSRNFRAFYRVAPSQMVRPGGRT